MIVRTLLLFLLALVLLRAVWRLLAGVAFGASGSAPGASPRQPAAKPSVKMAADPVCGTYVVPGKAIELARGRETLYFCSDQCRDEWVKRAH